MIYLYILLLTILTVFGFHRLSLILAYLKHKKNVPLPESKFKDLPKVTIQLPVFNEKKVIERLIRSVSKINYPKDKLQIQILDDSTEEDAVAIVTSLVKELKAQGLDIEVIQRVERKNYKAGALANGLKTAKGEFIAILDADFTPNSDFLQKVIHHFTKDNIGMVQVRWGYLNRAHSLLTKGQAVLLDGHFQIEHTARNRSKNFFNFNGTAGVWRKEAIIKAGNWQGDTLTEDLDLSYRAQLHGYEFIYLVDYSVPSELPMDIYAFKSQQHRWTLGSVQVFFKLAKRILFSKYNFSIKYEAFAHLGANFCYPLMLILGLMLVPLNLTVDINPKISLFASIFFLTGIISVLIFYSIAYKQSTLSSYPKSFLNALLGLFVGTALSLSNSIAVFEGLIKKEREFTRTPKSGFLKSNKDIKLKGQWRPWLVYIEGGLLLYFLSGLALCIINKNYAFVSFLMLFVVSFGFMTLENLRYLKINKDFDSLTK